jgi:hypothetical protein
MADMSWTGHWTSISVVDNFLSPCNFTLSIDFNTAGVNAARHHLAFSRIKHMVEETLHESVLISLDNPMISYFKNHTVSKVIPLTTDPLEVVIAATLWKKFNKITEDEIEIVRVSISSDQSDGMISHLEEHDLIDDHGEVNIDPFAAISNSIWWNRSDMGVSDWVEIDAENENKKTIHLDTTDWPEYLQWDFITIGKDGVIENPVKVTDNVVPLKKGKWKPEVIPGDKS